MDPLLFFCCAIEVGICATIYAYAVDKRKHLESNLGTLEMFVLYLGRCCHYFVFCIAAFYPFLADLNWKYDTMVIGFLGLIMLHWPILGECVLDILEKRILFPGQEVEGKLSFLELIHVPEHITRLPDSIVCIPVIALILRIGTFFF